MANYIMTGTRPMLTSMTSWENL